MKLIRYETEILLVTESIVFLFITCNIPKSLTNKIENNIILLNDTFENWKILIFLKC